MAGAAAQRGTRMRRSRRQRASPMEEVRQPAAVATPTEDSGAEEVLRAGRHRARHGGGAGVEEALHAGSTGRGARRMTDGERAKVEVRRRSARRRGGLP